MEKHTKKNSKHDHFGRCSAIFIIRQEKDPFNAVRFFYVSLPIIRAEYPVQMILILNFLSTN